MTTLTRGRADRASARAEGAGTGALGLTAPMIGHRGRDLRGGSGAEREGGHRLAAVLTNRSIPRASVVPILVYPDVREAVAWLETAFGFVEHVKIGEDHRSQLGYGDGAVITGDVRHDRRPPRTGEETHAVLVRVDDARAHSDKNPARSAREHNH